MRKFQKDVAFSFSNYEKDKKIRNTRFVGNLLIM